MQHCIYKFCFLSSFGLVALILGLAAGISYGGRKFIASPEDSIYQGTSLYACQQLGFPREQKLTKFITLGQGEADGGSMNICILALLDSIPTLIDG